MLNKQSPAQLMVHFLHGQLKNKAIVVVEGFSGDNFLSNNLGTNKKDDSTILAVEALEQKSFTTSRRYIPHNNSLQAELYTNYNFNLSLLATDSTLLNSAGSHLCNVLYGPLIENYFASHNISLTTHGFKFVRSLHTTPMGTNWPQLQVTINALSRSLQLSSCPSYEANNQFILHKES
jgi:hypothetical protein